MNMETIICYKDGCYIQFWVPKTWKEKKVEKRTDFWCPNGHRQAFCGKTEEQKVKTRCEELQRDIKNERESRNYWHEQAQTAWKSLSATKGHLTRLRNKRD